MIHTVTSVIIDPHGGETMTIVVTVKFADGIVLASDSVRTV
jgi:20S proteasome alpha/beta subunit